MSAVTALSLGLMAWTVVIVNGLITHFLPADLITGLGVMVDFAGWLVKSRALAVLTVLFVLAGGGAAWPLRGMDSRRRVAWLNVLGGFWLLLIVNAIIVLFSYFLRDLTDSFVARNVEGSRWSLAQIFVLLDVFAPVIYAYGFIESAFANFWREVMTLRFFGGYLGGRFFIGLALLVRLMVFRLTTLTRGLLKILISSQRKALSCFSSLLTLVFRLKVLRLF